SRNTGSRRSAFARSCAARKSFLGVVQAHYSARSSTSPRISLSLWRAPSCASTIQRVTLGHAGNMFEAGKISLDFPEAPGRHKDIVAETDGGMIPIVEPDARQ